MGVLLLVSPMERAGDSAVRDGRIEEGKERSEKKEGEMEERRRTVEGWIGEDKIKPLRRVHGFLWTEH